VQPRHNPGTNLIIHIEIFSPKHFHSVFCLKTFPVTVLTS